MGFRAAQYTYAPAPISPDPESTRQLQQFLNIGAGALGSPGAAGGAGVAGEAAPGGEATMKRSWYSERVAPMLCNAPLALGAGGSDDVKGTDGKQRAGNAACWEM